MVAEITRLGADTKRFEACGRTYIVHDSLTVDGFQRLEELRVEMEAGNTTGDLLKLLKTAYDAANKNRLADAAVAIYNALNINERIIEGRPQAWLLALTLFVRPEGSDLSTWNEADATEWVNEWNAAGYAIPDLFNLAYANRARLDTDFLASFPDTFTDGKKESEEGAEAQAGPNSAQSR